MITVKRAQIFQKSRSQVKILRATVQNLAATATWGPGFLTEIFKKCPLSLTGIALSVQRLATGWTVRDRIPMGRRDFPQPSTPALGPTQRGVDHSPHPPSSAEVEGRVEIHIYSHSDLRGLF